MGRQRNFLVLFLSYSRKFYVLKKDLLETTCIDDDDVVVGGRPNYQRLSANQLTDSNTSSFEEISSIDDDSTSASTSKQRRKSKSTANDTGRPNERSSSSSNVAGSSTTTEQQPNDDDVARQRSVLTLDTDLTTASDENFCFILSYEARLRKRQLRAKEMQEKIERIQAKLHQSSGWEKYKNYALGGAAILVGGLFIYFYCKFV